MIEIDGPHFLIVPEKIFAEARLSANHAFRCFVDPDRDRRIEAGSWWQIGYEGQRGWVFGEYVTTTDDENVAVATDIPPPPPPPTEPILTIDRNMNVRSGSGTFYPVLGTASPGDRYFITGKDRSGSWWRINFNHESGWIFSNLVTADGP